MGLVRVTSDNWSRFKFDIDAIEAGAEYPLGTDFFRIDHGSNYFSFFERLGELHYYAWLEKGKAVAVAAGIIRNLVVNGSKTRAWYLCDLKVHPNYRGKHIPLRLLTRALPLNYLRCPRCYAISMDPSNGSTNRTVKLLKQFQWIRFGSAAKLLIWSLNHQDMAKATPILEKHRGTISYLSLRGMKDIVLRSTGQPMTLLHAQFGPAAVAGTANREEGAVHMFCSPAQDPLAVEISNNLKIAASASATIISHRMDGNDWRWVLTSDI